MAALVANNASSTLAGGLTTGAITLTVLANTGAVFPDVDFDNDGNWFQLTLVNLAGNSEIVRCTKRVDDVLTIERGQESTTPLLFEDEDKVELRLTALSINSFSTVAVGTASTDAAAGNHTHNIGLRNLIALRDTGLYTYDSTVGGYHHTDGRVLINDGNLDRITFSGDGAYGSQPAKILDEGNYSLSFWYKVENYVSGTTLAIDINDRGYTSLDVSSDRDWTFHSHTAYINQTIYGFLDMVGTYDATVTVSDIVLVNGDHPVLEYIPAPEDLAKVDLSNVATLPSSVVSQLQSTVAGPMRGVGSVTVSTVASGGTPTATATANGVNTDYTFGLVTGAASTVAGAAATIAIGTTTTGNAGTDASVANAGTSSAATFNFTIPKGDTGADSTVEGPIGPAAATYVLDGTTGVLTITTA